MDTRVPRSALLRCEDENPGARHIYGGFPRGRRDPSPGLFLMGLVYLGGYFPTIGKLEQ